MHVLISRHSRLLARLLLMALLLMGVTLPFLFRQGEINTSILALLPGATDRAVPAALQEQMMEQLDQRLVWLVRAPDEAGDNSVDAVTAWADALSRQPLLKQISGRLPDAGEDWLPFIQRHMPALLDTQTLERLESGAERYARWVMAQLYSPVAGVSGSELRQDPLLLMRSLQSGSLASSSRFELHAGWPTVKDDNDRRWYIIQAELDSSAYAIRETRELRTFLTEAEQQWHEHWPGGEILSQGTLYYSSHASQQAQQDIQVLGGLTLLALFALILLTFRSLLPLLACLLSILAGVLCGLWSVLVVFSELHLITLVMSISVIGVTIDYVLYFLVERRIHGHERSPDQSIGITLPTLLSALTTTLIAYLVLAVPPLSVFRQLMVFSVSGMIAAFLVVLLWVPRLTANLPVRPLPARQAAEQWLALWRRPIMRVGLPGIILVLSLIGLIRLEISDDPTDLQALPADILHQEQRLAALLGQTTDQTWLLAYAPTVQAALQQFEGTLPRLEQAVETGLLSGYQGLALASQQAQRQREALLASLRPQVIEHLQEQGVLDSAPSSIPPTPQWQSLSASDWQESPAGLLQGDLLLNSADSPWAGIIVPLTGVSDVAALRDLLVGEGTALIDRRNDFTKLFADYRRILSALLLLAVLMVGGYFLLTRGRRQSLRCMLPTVISLLAAPASLQLVGYSFNLFAVLAMILVLGVGINYTLFFSNPRIQPATTLFVTLLAAATSLLTLGILVFSSTPAISGFGLVLATGLLVAFLLAPLAAGGVYEGGDKRVYPGKDYKDYKKVPSS